MTESLPAVVFSLSAAGYALFGLSVLVTGRAHAMARWVGAASLLSALWLAVSAAAPVDSVEARPLVACLELVRTFAWLAVLWVVLVRNAADALPERSRYLPLLVLAVVAWLAGEALVPAQLPGDLRLVLFGRLGLALLGIALIEQLYRNSDTDGRWAVKYFCLGTGVLFGFDFFLYAEAVLFRVVNPDVWVARGAVDLLALPPLLLALVRNPRFESRLFVSRHVVFYSTTLVGAGVYLVALAAAGYYLKTVGGTWGGAVRVVVVAAGLLAFISLITSAQLRAELRQFLARHFYSNKYDYAEQWVRFTDTMAEAGGSPASVGNRMIRAIADIVESTGAILYEVDGSGYATELTNWNLDYDQTRRLSLAPQLLARLREEQLVQVHDDVAVPAPEIPAALRETSRAWVLVPMMHAGSLVAIIVLGAPRMRTRLAEEDRALLVTVGKQGAGLLELVRLNERLAESKQFDTFNRLSAFVVHDIKNVVAQLALIERNAERFRDNPEFVDDAFNTVSSAVDRMNRLLANLRKAQQGSAAAGEFAVVPVLARVVERCGVRSPVPTLALAAADVPLHGDEERLATVLEHLVTNAQEATPDDGEVSVTLLESGDRVRIAVTDTGEGMSRAFIAERLFRPFDTTKGNAGMGVGVYEARHVVEEWGGTLTVVSEEGQGTTFTLTLPAAQDD